jgi:3',5'-cyclic AMP phosphodiesterase CpdA
MKKYKNYYPAALLITFVISVCLSIGSSFLPANSAGVNEEQKNNSLKIVQLTDVHYDTKNPNRGARMLSQSAKLLKEAISQINKMKDVDAVVFSGDCINKPDESEFEGFIKTANTLKFPWYASTGNHDIGIGGGLSKTEFIKYLNKMNPYIKDIKNPYYTVYPEDGYKLIFLDGVIGGKITANGYFSQIQLKWLEKELRKNDDLKVIIVQHFPVIEPFKSEDHKVFNSREYLKLLSRHKNVIAVISGHYHSEKITPYKGILHISTPALVEYPNSFNVIEAYNDEKGFVVKVNTVDAGLKNTQKKSDGNSNINTSERNAVFHFPLTEKSLQKAAKIVSIP